MERKRRVVVVVVALRIKSKFNGIATSKGAHRCAKTLGGTLISGRQAFTKHTTPKWVSHGSLCITNQSEPQTDLLSNGQSRNPTCRAEAGFHGPRAVNSANTTTCSQSRTLATAAATRGAVETLGLAYPGHQERQPR